jgi:aminomethyltransferase
MIGKKTPLHDWHASNGARFVEFGGWQLPEVYGKSVEQEYATLRNGAGVVDLCHEARYRIEGRDAVTLLQELMTIDVTEIDVRQARFGYLCNDRGGIIDGMLVYRDQSYYLLLGSGAMRYQALDWLESHARSKEHLEVKVVDVTTAQGQIGLIGPGATPILDRVILGTPVALNPGHGTVATIDNARCLVIRRPSEGYDIVTGSVYVQPVWDKIIEVLRSAGSRPVGLAAREIVRLESGIPQYGLEIDEDTTPLEIGQNGSVDFRKTRFFGRRALMHSLSAEFTRALVALRVEMDRPLEMDAEIIMDNFPIGRITSFAISPMLRCKLALGFVSVVRLKPGTAVSLRNKDGQVYRAEIIRPGLSAAQH